MLGPLLGLTLYVCGVIFRDVLRKVHKSGNGEGKRVGVCGFPLSWGSTGGRGNALAYSFSLTLSLESQALCPLAFPIKKNLLF